MKLKSVSVVLGVLVALTPIAEVASAQDGESLFGIDSASVTYGPYFRADIGYGPLMPYDAYWLPHGQDDPQVNFDPNAEDAWRGSVAFGYDWQNGLRAEAAVLGSSVSGLTAPCVSTSNDTDCIEHSDITDGSIKTSALFANLYYAPLEGQGSNARLQPFVVAGLGVASNTMGEWTRTKNPEQKDYETRTVRTFEGDTTSSFAWSVGAGLSYQITKAGQRPVIVEASWRYFDFGNAMGGGDAVPFDGASVPRTPFNFHHTSHVVSIGVRIPLQRY